MGKYVVTIGDNGFLNCKKLNKVILGGNVKKIGVKAFGGCTALRTLTLPSRVTTIGKQAFYGCSRLKTLVIKSTKLTSKTVGSNAFGRIYGKATVKVPAKQLKSYTKMLKTKGMSGKVKFVKG